MNRQKDPGQFRWPKIKAQPRGNGKEREHGWHLQDRGAYSLPECYKISLRNGTIMWSLLPPAAQVKKGPLDSLGKKPGDCF